MTKLIQERIAMLEKEHGVNVLLAVESGSRAWGFSSENSDWDVRVIYKRPLASYLKIHPDDNFLDSTNMDPKYFTDDIDFQCWDIDKTLQLLHKGNPPLLEWLSSPFIYKADETFFKELTILASSFWSRKRAIYHYIHMAEGNYKSYIKDKDWTQTKKYLYVLRPLLCCEYIMNNDVIPPIEMSIVLNDYAGSEGVKQTIQSLVNQKRAGAELGLQAPNIVLNSWIESELIKFKDIVKVLPETYLSDVPLNEFFLKKVNPLS